MPQQVTTGPAPMEGVERTNTIVLRELGVGQSAVASPRWDSFAIEVDQGQNCYACRGFGHMAHHCRDRGQRERVAEERRLKYGGGKIKGINEHLDNLKGVENLESLN